MGTTSTIGGVEIHVQSIYPVIERRTFTVNFERATSRHGTIGRGGDVYRVEAFVLDDDDYDDVVTVWKNSAEAVFTDNQRADKYTDTYILGSLEIDDRTRSSPFIWFTFTMLVKNLFDADGIGFNSIAEEMVGG